MMRKFLVMLLLGTALVGLPVFATEVININTADTAELERLNGVGPSRAKAIVEFREENGPFLTVADLALVPGIGPKTVEQLEGRITID